MGYRLQRRGKLFGGLGLNLSKSGVSWSIRTPAGSVGPKSYSIRTGLKGLTYKGSFKKVKSNNKTEQNSLLSAISVIVSIGIVSYFFFSSFFEIYFLIICVIILLILTVKISSLFKTRKNKVLNKQTVEPFSDTNFYDSPENFAFSNSKHSINKTESYIMSDNSIDKRVNLNESVILFIENQCTEFCDILEEARQVAGILNRMETIEISLKEMVIYDLCKVFSYLDIPVIEECAERDFLLIAVGYMVEPQIRTEQLNTDIDLYNQFLEIIDGYIYRNLNINEEMGNELFAIPVLFKPYPKLLSDYKVKLIEFAALITTIDYNLTRKENKVIELIRGI